MHKTLVMTAAALFLMAPAAAFSQTDAATAPAEVPAAAPPATDAPAAETPAQPPLEEIAPSYDEDFGLGEDPADAPRSYSAFGEDDATPPAEVAAPDAPAAAPTEAAIPAVEWSGEPQTPE